MAHRYQTTNSERQVLHEILELPDDDSDICEIIMLDNASMPRREENRREHAQPSSAHSDIFTQQPQAGPSSLNSLPFTDGDVNTSPSQARERVAEFLTSKEKIGTPLNSMEREGIMSMLRKASAEGMSSFDAVAFVTHEACH